MLCLAIDDISLQHDDSVLQMYTGFGQACNPQAICTHVSAPTTSRILGYMRESSDCGPKAWGLIGAGVDCRFMCIAWRSGYAPVMIEKRLGNSAND